MAHMNIHTIKVWSISRWYMQEACHFNIRPCHLETVRYP